MSYSEQKINIGKVVFSIKANKYNINTNKESYGNNRENK